MSSPKNKETAMNIPTNARFQAVRPHTGVPTSQLLRFPSIGGFSPAGIEADTLEGAIANAHFDAVAVIVYYARPAISIVGAVAIG